MVRGLVANGFGYSLLNAPLSNDQALDGRRFAAIPLSDKIRPLSLGIVRPAQSRLTRATAAFAEHCHETWARRQFPRQAGPGPDKAPPRKAPRARRRGS